MPGMISSMSPPRVVRHQHLSTKVIARRSRSLRQVLIGVAVAASILLLFVWVRVRVLQLGYEVKQYRSIASELAVERARVEAQIAALKSPARLGKIAEEVFQMRPPRGVEIVYVPPPPQLEKH